LSHKVISQSLTNNPLKAPADSSRPETEQSNNHDNNKAKLRTGGRRRIGNRPLWFINGKERFAPAGLVGHARLENSHIVQLKSCNASRFAQ
jgi:hypothetical protein